MEFFHREEYGDQIRFMCGETGGHLRMILILIDSLDEAYLFIGGLIVGRYERVHGKYFSDSWVEDGESCYQTSLIDDVIFYLDRPATAEEILYIRSI